MLCVCSFKSIQGCQAHQIFIFLDSFSEHVLLGGCRGFSRIFQPLKITPPHSSAPAQTWRESPFPGTNSNASHGRPVDPPSANRLLCLFPPLPDGKRILIAEHIFLDTQSLTPSFQREGKKKEPNAHLGTTTPPRQQMYIVACSKIMMRVVFVKFTDKMFQHT
ncbi:hypothetical protein SEVIR_1G098951v4 [Setaria viridis]